MLPWIKKYLVLNACSGVPLHLGIRNLLAGVDLNPGEVLGCWLEWSKLGCYFLCSSWCLGSKLLFRGKPEGSSALQ